MKIDPGQKPVTLPAAGENRPAQAQANTRADTEQTAVTLSQRAAKLKQLETQLAAIPVIDRARVDSIKQAIASGQYTIKPENIADGLIDSVKEMLRVAK
ncbi:flagellar biosynthesis anti-sigma factor FlgM [Thiobacillus denitrificans]|uniref:Negative regulator of flagellin synthesis n=1 Tax=Thiobacillus denitrificans TaxID=36861 RepID=A0A106BPG3_THIDE|nr:flagellar biosynthesis anti-sigma factor FlgM [Thiobacillus denitrificans]KVW96110.1 flagellar biosynthesis anti-sigma factor FlgM [Thiobacillus denitrificans]